MRCFPSILLLLSSLLPASQASDNCAGHPGDHTYCAPLSYVDTTSKFHSPPSADDCQHTCRGVNADAGDWLVDFSKDAAGAHHSILGSRCGFSVARGDGTPRDARFHLSNQDILNLFDASIRRFAGAHGGRISAEGSMLCNGMQIRWYIQ